VPLETGNGVLPGGTAQVLTGEVVKKASRAMLKSELSWGVVPKEGSAVP